MTLEHALIILYFSLLIVIFLVIIIILRKFSNLRYQKKQGEARDFLFDKYFDHKDVLPRFSERFFFDAYIDVETQIDIEPTVREQVVHDLSHTRFFKKQVRNLKSLNSIKRKKAIFYVGSLRRLEDIEQLKLRLKKEKKDSLKFYLFYYLKSHITDDVFEMMMDALKDMSDTFRQKVYALINQKFQVIQQSIYTYLQHSDFHIQTFIIYVSKRHIDPVLKAHLIEIFLDETYDLKLKHLAFDALSSRYPEDAISYLSHQDTTIVTMAIGACGEVLTEDMLFSLIEHMDGTTLDEARIKAISRMVYTSKNLLLATLEYYPKSKNMFERKAIAKVLAHRIEYLVLKLKSDHHPYVKHIVKDILDLHIIEDFMDFLNHNKDLDIQKNLLAVLKPHLLKDQYLLDQASIYLNQNILKEMGLIKKPMPVLPRDKAPIEKSKIYWISTFLVLSILLFPILFLVISFKDVFINQVPWFPLFVVSINRYLVIYFLTVNTIYILLLFISLKSAKDIEDLWHIKRSTLLFEKDVLPSISIIAPAYNEEKSIIESVTSLLNLKYPNYEVIVVNDGSKDLTIDVLIEHFKLDRKHPFFKQTLNTRPLRGVYVNKHIPNLIVIDKHNGGKADALNLGINVAKNDFVCGIDADSILDEDALLKLMSITLDHEKPFIAIGGNIAPVNGCLVDKGRVDHTGLGKKTLVRFQTLEYLRAFTTGRLGWAKLKSLLIISGAFGLFNRKSLLDTGGYLSISGDLKKDTVGEDMELVVRLTFQALKEKKPYLVGYVHHANCYTELPSDRISLLKQRNRWQRGLLDILSYHRKLLFNPKFKQPGMIAFPYFFTFEMIGPFLEMIGYMALLTGLILGILNAPLVILLFIVTIGYGMVISLVALYITERRNPFYTVKETFLLICFAVIENFGYRQWMSMHRVKSSFSALKESGSWGTQQRQGFQPIKK